MLHNDKNQQHFRILWSNVIVMGTALLVRLLLQLCLTFSSADLSMYLYRTYLYGTYLETNTVLLDSRLRTR
jgi:hypothetical protein